MKESSAAPPASEDRSIEHLLIEGKLAEALDRLEEINQSAQKNSELWAFFKSQYNASQGAFERGEISREEATLQVNRVTQAVLGLVQGMTKAIQPYFRFYAANPLGDWDEDNRDSLRIYLSTRLDGKYSIDPVPLGEGNTCIIFKIKDLYTGRDEVLRVLKTANLKGLDNEVKNVSRLKHRNIISIHEVYFKEFPYFVTTEYVPSESLDYYIDRFGRRPFFEVRDMAARLGDTLQYLRDKKIFLALVRPSKIMLDEENQPVISPFDIIKASDPSRAKEKVKEDCLYWPPELLDDEKMLIDIDNAGTVDQYSLGLLMYELLVGMPLFARGLGVFASPRRCRDMNAVPLAAIVKNREMFHHDRRFRAACLAELDAAGAPKKVRSVLDRMLRLDPLHRYPSFGEAIRALTAIPPGMPEAQQAVVESYQRCLRANEDFVPAFYQKVQADGHFPPHLVVFPDPERQHKMFRGIVTLLTESDDSHPFWERLPRLSGHRDLLAEHYRRFLDLFIETVSETDPFWAKRPELRAHWQNLTDALVGKMQKTSPSPVLPN